MKGTGRKESKHHSNHLHNKTKTKPQGSDNLLSSSGVYHLKCFCDTFFKKLFTSDKDLFLKLGLALPLMYTQCVWGK